jgi:hypothetical protein
VAIIFASVAANIIKFLVLVFREIHLLIFKRCSKIKKDHVDTDISSTNLAYAKFVIPVKGKEMNLPGVYMNG